MSDLRFKRKKVDFVFDRFDDDGTVFLSVIIIYRTMVAFMVA